MKFLIQKIGGQIVHDFSFTLLESIRYNNWIHNNKDITFKFVNTIEVVEPDDIYPMIPFKQYYYTQKYVPIGTVEFVNEFLAHFYGFVLKPINVPEELFHYAGREIFNGNNLSFINLGQGKFFFKSNDKIKGYSGYYDSGIPTELPAGDYQISKFIYDIISEWRAFVYEGKLVGLQNYSGDFTMFPSVSAINGMIEMYKSAPIAYSLDIGISNERGTFVIECGIFSSMGLYGFAIHKLLPLMFYKCFYEIIKKSK